MLFCKGETLCSYILVCKVSTTVCKGKIKLKPKMERDVFFLFCMQMYFGIALQGFGPRYSIVELRSEANWETMYN